MTDQDLDNLYKQNIGTSHYAALRGVFNAGVNVDKGLSAAQVATAPDAAASTAASTAAALTPTITQP